MKILWLTWKDIRHPQAGGAEVVNEELAKRLAGDGHEVIFLTAMSPGAAREETRDGFRIIRMGTRFSVYWRAYQYYKQHLKDWPDLVIDEMNTIPFFAKFYARQKNILFVHQLCREVWFYQMPFPISLVGYVLEPMYLWLLRDREVITVSESTKKDLMRFGFSEKKIHIISEGIELEPVADIASVQKVVEPTILAHGAVRPMKRTLHTIRAFNIVKRSRPSARLVISGDTTGAYGARVLRAVAASPFKRDIEVTHISNDEKGKLLGSCHLLLATSVKEGWGIVVTEANSQGTPVVVYDVDGLRDSVKDGETGIICKRNTPECLAENILKLLDDEERYAKLRENAWRWSKEVNFDTGYRQFASFIERYVHALENKGRFLVH